MTLEFKDRTSCPHSKSVEADLEKSEDQGRVRMKTQMEKRTLLFKSAYISVFLIVNGRQKQILS